MQQRKKNKNFCHFSNKIFISTGYENHTCDMTNDLPHTVLHHLALSRQYHTKPCEVGKVFTGFV